MQLFFTKIIKQLTFNKSTKKIQDKKNLCV